MQRFSGESRHIPEEVRRDRSSAANCDGSLFFFDSEKDLPSFLPSLLLYSENKAWIWPFPMAASPSSQVLAGLTRETLLEQHASNKMNGYLYATHSKTCAKDPLSLGSVVFVDCSCLSPKISALCLTSS